MAKPTRIPRPALTNAPRDPTHRARDDTPEEADRGRAGGTVGVGEGAGAGAGAAEDTGSACPQSPSRSISAGGETTAALGRISPTGVPAPEAGPTTGAGGAGLGAGGGSGVPGLLWGNACLRVAEGNVTDGRGGK